MSTDSGLHSQSDTSWLSDASADGQPTHLWWWMLWSVIGIAVLVGGGIVWQASGELSRLESQRFALRHAQDVLDVLSDFQEHHKNVQRTAGDYFRTGDRNTLDPMAQETDKARQSLKNLSEMLRDQQDREQYERISALFEQQLQHLQKMQALYESRGAADIEFFAEQMNRGRPLIDQLDQQIALWRQGESAALSASDALTDALINTRRVVQWVVACSVMAVVALLLTVARHVRHQEQLRRQLNEAMAAWRNTLEALTQGVGLYTTDGRLLLWNRRFAVLHGVPDEQLFPGITVGQLAPHSALLSSIAGGGIQQCIDTVRQVMQNDRLVEVEYLRPDGIVVYAQIKAMDASHYVVMLTDVTLLRASEQAARDQSTRVRAIMDSVPDAVMTINASGVIESWNGGAMRLLGYALADVVGRDVTMLMSEQDSVRHRQGFQRYLQSGSSSGSAPMTLTARHQNGRPIAVEMRVGQMEIAGERMLIGVMRDLTQQHMVESMKREFVSVVSHELRTPLTSILGSLSLLPQAIAQQQSDQTRRLLSLAEKNGQRLAALINDILDLDKAEAGHLQLVKRERDLLQVVQQAMDANRGYAMRFNVTLHWRADAERYLVNLDEGRILQVLTNLFSNAIKHTPDSSQVLVTLQSRSQVVRVTVHDDGPGIAESFRARVFERFAQADGSDARRQAGTGLGLAIAKHLVELHGGRIGFDSGQSAVGAGQGASFWFELPRSV